MARYTVSKWPKPNFLSAEGELARTSTFLFLFLFVFVCLIVSLDSLKAIIFRSLLSGLFLLSVDRASSASDATNRTEAVYKTVGDRKLTLNFDFPPDWKLSNKRPA